jgi:two-component system sensor histidine kinase/response regulator
VKTIVPPASPEGVKTRKMPIVVIDDDHAIRLSCSQALTKTGYDVTTFEDGASGLKGVTEIKPELLVVDLKMAGLSGLEVIERVHQIDPDIVIIVITGYATIGTAVDAMKAGAYDFLPKPFKPDELRIIVARGLERRRLLLDARRAGMERELMKRRFVTFVSHQLKTPLVAVHQYLEVMARMEDSGQQLEQRRQWLERCLNRTREMQDIIEDWLTLARIEGGYLVGKSEEVELKGVISAIVDSYRPMAAAEGVSLIVDMPEERYVATGDHNSFSVLFDNLITNAIKYNRPGGSVTVKSQRTPGVMSILVADTGVGVAKEDVPFLFDEFFRGTDRGGKKTSGTGLGLPICKRIVTELGGRIEVTSDAGTGSVFRVELPAVTGKRNGGRNVGSLGEKAPTNGTPGR